MKNWLVGTLLLVLSCASVFAQSPYRTSLGLDLPLTGGTTALAVGGHFYQSTITPLPATDLFLLDANDIWRFDRIATTGWRPLAATHSDWGLLAGFVAPLGLLAAGDIRQNWGQHLLLWWQTMSMVDGVTTWTKTLTLRPRPFNYYYSTNYPNHPTDLDEFVGVSDARFSFFSGHTSYTSASTFFFAKTFSDYYPNSPAKPWVWAGAAVLPAVVGYLRVRAGKHYPSDVITGYLIGAAIGVAIPHLHKIR